MDKAGLAALLQDTGYSTGDPVLDSIYGVQPLTEADIAQYLPPEAGTYGATPMGPEPAYGETRRDTRGVRNNNPGNLNFAGQAGAVKEGGPNGRFAVFQSPEEGLNALSHQLRTYQGRGINTVGGMISKWAPPTENNTQAYISRVSNALGVAPDQAIDVNDPTVMHRMMTSIIQMENGHNPYSAEQIAAVAGGTPQGASLRSFTTPSGQTISVPADLSDDEVATKMLEQYPDQARQLGFTPPEEANLESFKTPSGQEIKVPKGLTPEQIAAKMLAQYPEQAKKLGFQPPKGPEATYGAAAKAGLEEAGSFVSGFGAEALKRAGMAPDLAATLQQKSEALHKEAGETYRPLTDEEVAQQGLAGKFHQNIGQPLVHGLTTYGLPLAAGTLGGPVAGPLGALGTIATGGGQVLQEAKDAGKELSNWDFAWHTGVETIANYLRVPMGKLAPLASRLGDVEKKEVLNLINTGNVDAAIQKAGSYLGQVGKAVLGTGATAGAGSALSEANRIAVEGGDLMSPESGQRVLEAGKAGAIAMTPLGVVHGHLGQTGRRAEIENLARGREDLQRQLGRSQQERDLEGEVDEQGYSPEDREILKQAELAAARQKLQEQAGVTPPTPPTNEQEAAGTTGVGEPTPPPPPPPGPGETGAPPSDTAVPPEPPKQQEEVTPPPPPEPVDLTKATQEDIEANLTKLNEQSNAFMDANDYANYDLVQKDIQAHEAELRRRDAEAKAAEAGKKEEVKAPPEPPKQEAAAPAPTPEIGHFVERLKFKKPGTKLETQLAKLDPNNPEDIKIALNKLAGFRDVEIPGVEALRQDLNRALANQPPLSPLAGVPKKVAPTEVTSAQQIPETSTPDGGSSAQPILREKGGDQAVGGKGVEPSGQGEQAPEAKATEEKVAADWNKNKAADTPVWDAIPEGVRELYREHLKGFAYESPEEIYNNYEFNESGKTWDQMKQPETPAWADLGDQHKIRVDFHKARQKNDFVLPENLLEPEKKAVEVKAPEEDRALAVQKKAQELIEYYANNPDQGLGSRGYETYLQELETALAHEKEALAYNIERGATAFTPDNQRRVDELTLLLDAHKAIAPGLKGQREKAMAEYTMRDIRGDLDDAVAEGHLTKEEAKAIVERAAKLGETDAFSDYVAGAIDAAEDGKLKEYLAQPMEGEALTSKQEKALPAPKEPLTEAAIQHVEATTVPRGRGRPKLSPEEKAKREEAKRIADAANKAEKKAAREEQKRAKAETKAAEEGKQAKPTRKEKHDATEATLSEQIKATKEKLDALPRPEKLDHTDLNSWSPADVNWLKHHIDYVAAQRDFHQHRAHSKHLSDAEIDEATKQEAIFEKQLSNLTQVHRAAERSLVTRKATEAPKQKAEERVTRAEVAEAWNTDKPAGHAAWEELSPTAQAHWQEAVSAGSHLHPELNKAIRDEIDTLNKAEAAEQEHAREGRITRGLGLEPDKETGELRMPHSIELAGALTKGIKEKDVAKVAQALIDQQRNPIIREIANRVKKIITSGLKITEASMDDPRLAGHGAFYDPATNTIHIASSHLMDAPTIAHEMVHALTHYVLDHPKSANQKAAVFQIKQLFDAVKGHESIKDKYGVTDIHEFVAEGLSNPEFQRALAKIPYKTQSAWGAFVQKIAQMLGLRHDNALTELLGATDKLMPSKEGTALKTDAKKGLMYAPPADDDARALSEARLTRTLPPDHKLMMQQAEETLSSLRKPGGFGELFANLRYGLVSRDSKLAYALRNDPTFSDGKFRADLLLSQYGHLNQFVSEGIRLGIPFRTSTGMMKIALDPEKNLIGILERAHNLPKELGNGPDALANTLRALIGEHWMKEPERLRDRIEYLKNDEKLVREYAHTLSGDAKTEALRTANKLRRELDHAQERLDKLPETGLEVKVQPEHIDAAKRMMEKYPELKKLVDDVHGVMRGLVDLHESVGLIDSFTARQWRKAPYIPLYMSMDDLAKREGEGQKPFGPSAKGLRAVKQKGVSEHEVNVFENLQKHYFWMTQTAFQNNVRRGTMEQLSRWGMAERLTEIPKSVAEKAKLVLTREFGNDVWHKVDDPYIVDVMSFTTPHGVPSFLTTPSRAFSRLTLMNPGYWFKQLVRDPFVANFVSRTGIVTPFGAAKSFLRIVSGSSPEYDILRAHGVTGLVDAVNDSVRFSQGAGKPNPMRSMWDKMKHIHEAADAATRVEVYKQAMKEAKKKGLTGDVAEAFAVNKAREIINFSNQGAHEWVNYFSRTVPFFSAGLNSLDVVARAALGTNLPPAEAAHARKLFRNRALVMTAVSTAYAYNMAMNSQAYRDASDHDWTNAWLIEPPASWGWAPGRMIKIPSPFEIGFMFKFLPELFVRNMLHLTDSERSKELTWETAKQTLPIQPLLNPIPVLFRPTVEVAANYNFFGKYGIETPAMQGQEVKYRGAEKASTLANWLAQNTPERAQMSPVKWDHFLTASFSELYKTMTMMADLMIAPEGKMTAKDITEKAPLVRVIATNPNHYSGADDFYDVKQGSEQFKNSFVRAKKQGAMAQVEEMLARPGGLDKYGAAALLNKQGEILGRWEMFRQQIINSSLSEGEKKRRLDELAAAKKNLVQFYGNVSKGIRQRIEDAEDAAEEEDEE